MTMKKQITVDTSPRNVRQLEARIEIAPSHFLVAYGRTEKEATSRLLRCMEREQDRREREAEKMAQLIAYNS